MSERRCDNPTPQHGGQQCPGESRRTSICNTGVHCPGKHETLIFNFTHKNIHLNLEQMPFFQRNVCVFLVDGVWSDWSAWGKCLYPFDETKSINCEQVGGSQTRNRECLYRDHNGTACSGSKLTDRQVCYDVAGCTGGWS